MRLVAVVGPTGVGKSRLAIQLAENWNAEIISADSRQVYRYLDIGTAKPAPQELELVPHHLIDIINPDEDFSLAIYKELSYALISDIRRRGRLPLLVGGSGLYVWAVQEGWEIPRVAPDPGFRRRLEARAVRDGGQGLFEELVRLDPAAAERIDRGNIRRIIRALELGRSGTSTTELDRKIPPPFETLIIGLTAERGELYRRTDARVDAMIERGLVEEVRNLIEMGYNLDLPALSSVGYREIGMHLRGELTLPEAIRRIKVSTHRLVRHQYNWFRLTDERIHWLDIKDDIIEQSGRLMTEFLS